MSKAEKLREMQEEINKLHAERKLLNEKLQTALNRKPVVGDFIKKIKKKPQSRSARFQEIIDNVSDAKGELEDLKQELEDWLENMPENLQESQKAEEIQEAIDSLDEVIVYLEQAETQDVEFPGMY